MKWFVLFICITGAAAVVIHVPLQHVETRRIRLIREGKWEEHQRMKEAFRMKKIKSKSSYYRGVRGQGNCLTKQRYDSSQSSTYSEDGRKWHMGYGDGSHANGFYGMDTLMLGLANGSHLRIPEQVFGQASYVYGFDNDPFDGILGLGFTYLADHFVAPPIVNAIDQGLLDEPIFTAWMSHKGLQENVYSGQFTYGGFDPKHCGPVIAYQHLSMAGYWEYRMKAVGVGNYLNRKGWNVIADTGTSFIGGPQYVLDQIAVVLGATYDFFNGVYTIPCGSQSKLQNIAFHFGAHAYDIEPANYVVKLREDLCTIGMSPFEFGGYGPSWILGNPLMRQYCVVHDVDQQRIGFALKKNI